MALLINTFACWLCFMIYFHLLTCFQNLAIKKIYQENYQIVLNGLDTDQDRHYVGPDLGPNCLQRLITYSKGRVNAMIVCL